jgi:serine/threonine protein kinase
VPFYHLVAIFLIPHFQIVKLIEVFFPEEEYSSIVFLVLEFVESNLKLVIEDIRRPICEIIPRFYFTQILYGVIYLHHIGIMHRVSTYNFPPAEVNRKYGQFLCLLRI